MFAGPGLGSDTTVKVWRHGWVKQPPWVTDKLIHVLTLSEGAIRAGF